MHDLLESLADLRRHDRRTKFLMISLLVGGVFYSIINLLI